MLVEYVNQISSGTVLWEGKLCCAAWSAEEK